MKLSLSFHHTPSFDKPDQQLLIRLKSGDAKAVTEWFNQYHSKLLKHILAKVSLSKDAEELVQDTFISCLKHLPLFRGESSIWTWMQRIAHHEVADYYRKKYAKKAIHALPFDDLILAQPIEDAHGSSVKVKEAMSHLRVDYRELLLLKYVDKKKVEDIATELGRTVKSIESDLFRARKAFKVAYVEIEDHV